MLKLTKEGVIRRIEEKIEKDSNNINKMSIPNTSQQTNNTGT
jgi:hypothetical protein